ncbi:uncharacterized protein EAE98_005236 [Botrytis deweyae]|uniref:Uncharacterized protein n=1 Tax=Botrytis deweyae TaxID=2478750 RepID=A0ABQ7IND6_9HELO|nr:uncharacterized protein EAE98_005236 [Botrytis deweyae]KAF7929317.1 hypothetical protein EAE98_005236 [Botrytis deweyae]
MDQRNLINVTKISTSTFDNIFTNLATQQMAPNISFEGQLPKTLSRNTLNDSGSKNFDDCSNDRLMIYYVTIFLLALLCAALYDIYLWIRIIHVVLSIFQRNQLKIKLKEIVEEVDKIDMKIQMKDMKIEINKMEMKVDDLEGKVDEKLTQERLDHQNKMLDWKTQAQKEKDDLQGEILKIQDKLDQLEQ